LNFVGDKGKLGHSTLSLALRGIGRHQSRGQKSNHTGRGGGARRPPYVEVRNKASKGGPEGPHEKNIGALARGFGDGSRKRQVFRGENLKKFSELLLATAKIKKRPKIVKSRLARGKKTQAIRGKAEKWGKA